MGKTQNGPNKRGGQGSLDQGRESQKNYPRNDLVVPTIKKTGRGSEGFLKDKGGSVVTFLGFPRP